MRLFPINSWSSASPGVDPRKIIAVMQYYQNTLTMDDPIKFATAGKGKNLKFDGEKGDLPERRFKIEAH